MATTDPMVGRLLEGRYRILDRIARGGMSTVYSALDQRLDRRVAVKVMSSALSADPKFSDRFAREARAAARLTHVNAVAVYDQGIDTTHASHDVFLVMELVDGRTLRDLMREREGRFTPAEAVSIMEPVLSALSAAHRAGLVHRDVKPENILLSDDGLVKVADFGLARAVDADAASTRTGLMMGTVAYCAPEQIVHGSSDQRSDVYSAGIVLFELLTGRPPYQGSSAMNVAYQHVHSRVPAPSSRVKGIPTPIDEIVVAATDSDPAGRPVDASNFLAELADTRAALALPIVAIPPRQRPSAPGRPIGAARSPQQFQPRTPPRPGPVGPARATAPVGGPQGGSTEVMGGAGFAGHATQVVRTGAGDRRGAAAGRPPGRTDGPPPPVVIPPRRQQRQPLTPRARRRRRRLIVLIVFLVLGALSLAAGITGARLFREWNSTVPKVGGLQRVTAAEKLQEAGYTVDPSITSAFSETVPAGAVIGTDPDTGARLAQGKTVRLVVSLGKDRVNVPDVASQSLAAAQTMLGDRGLKFDPASRQRPSKTVPQGAVVTTDPPPGTPVKRSQVIVLVQSSGPPTVAVPSFDPATTTFDQAKASLDRGHFQVNPTYAYNDTVPAGNVISTDPGDKAPYGSTITVVVSKGPEYVTVPDYSSLITDATDYEQALTNLGLHPDVRALLGGRQGRVLSVDPGPGAQVHPGDPVTVTVV